MSQNLRKGTKGLSELLKLESIQAFEERKAREGHGLGLAIASSYTANMGGRMELAADGDLFKVILRFPEAGEDSAAGETATKT